MINGAGMRIFKVEISSEHRKRMRFRGRILFLLRE